MRCKHAFFLLLAGIFVIPNLTWSQQKGAKAFTKALASDPDKVFDNFSGGKDVIVVSQLEPKQQMFLQGIAKSFNVSLGDRVTRAEFKDKVTAVTSMVKSGEIANPLQKAKSGEGSQSSKGAQPVGVSQQTDRLEELFRRLDRDKDGLLSPDEIPEEFRHEVPAFDVNHDGFIEFNEFKEFMNSSRPKPSVADHSGDAEKRADKPGKEDVKHGVYRAGKLPKGLPEWFARLDNEGDCDGQVGLWEARNDPKVLEEFNKMDLNGDGLLTAEEVLRYLATQKKKSGPARESAVLVAAAQAPAPLPEFNPSILLQAVPVPEPTVTSPSLIPVSATTAAPVAAPKSGQAGTGFGGYRDRGSRGNNGYGGNKPKN